MPVSLLLAQEIAKLFLILLLGVAVVRAGLLHAADSRVLSVILVYLIVPCVILNAFQIEDTPELRAGLLFALGLAGLIPDGKAILMTVFLAAITPACATLTSMAQLYDCDVRKASSLYVLSILTMPVMIGLYDLVI